MWWYLGILLLTFFVGYFATLSVRLITAAKGWVAQPSADRWHETPTALHGGVGIFVAFCVGALFLVLGLRFELIPLSFIGLSSGYSFYSTFLIITIGVGIMFLVGLIDDIFHLKPAVKLLGELFAISLVIFLGIGYDLTTYVWVDLLLSYLWFVGIVNAVNLLDNMDGVSSGVVIIGTLGVCLIGIFGYADFVPPSVLIGGILAVSALGFWLHNKPPAKIFMGDSGSLVLGFVFAAITIPSDLNAFYIPKVDFSIWDKVMQLLIAVILAAIPILDTTLVTITRLMRGQSPSQGGKDHSTHRLAHSGLTNWQTLKILYSVSAACALVALVIVLFPQVGFLVFGAVFLIMTIAAVYLASVRIQVAPIRDEGWQQLITSMSYRLPLIKMVMDVIIIGLSFHLAYLVRFDFNPNHSVTVTMLGALPLVVIGCLISNFFLRVYDFSWKTAKSKDIVIYAATACIGSLVSLALISLAGWFGISYSRGAFFLFFIFYFFAMAATRYSYRFIDESLLRVRLNQGVEGKIPLVLFGVNQNSVSVIDEIMSGVGRWGNYKVVALVERNETWKGRKIGGISIVSEKEFTIDDSVSQPEVLLLDESIDHAHVRAFANNIGEDLRVRALIQRILDIS